MQNLKNKKILMKQKEYLEKNTPIMLEVQYLVLLIEKQGWIITHCFSFSS